MNGRGFAARRLAPLSIVLAAAGLRLWGLGDVPPGFQFDEAHNAIDAARFIDGIRPLFLPDNGGREIFLTWLQAPALDALGREHPAFALRLVNALVGTLTVALAGTVIGRLFGDRRLGWLAAGFLATMYWHLHFSRYAIRAILAPLWATGAFGAWWLATTAGPGATDRGSPDGRRAPADAANGPARAPKRSGQTRIGVAGWSAVTGICLAAAVYSHPSGRLLPFVLVAHAALRVAMAGSSARPSRPAAAGVARLQARALAVAGAVAFALFLPLGAYFLRHPELFTGHASDVSLAAVAAREHGGSIARALGHNAAAIGGMFVVAGDPSTFHNLPDLTVYDPLSALLAVCGAGVLLGVLWAGRPGAPDTRVARTADAAALALVWLLVGLVPTLLSDRPPNYSRAIAATPIIALLPALGLRWFAAALGRADLAERETRGRSAWRLGIARIADPRALAVVALAVAAAWTTWHHFVAFPAIEHVYYSYDVEKLDAFGALEELAEDAAGGTAFLHPLWARHATIDYLNRYRVPGLSGEGDGDGATTMSAIRMLDPRDTLVLHSGRGSIARSDTQPDSGAVVLAVPARHDDREAVLASAITLLPADVRPERDGAEAPNRAGGPTAGSGDGSGVRATSGIVTDALGAPLLATLSLPAALWGDMAPPADAPLEPAVWTGVRFGGAIELVGYSLGEARPGADLDVRLVWRAVEPLARDLTVFVHLVGTDDQAWGQDDREPGHASFRTSAWRTGDIVLDRHLPTLDPRADGRLSVCIGWYELSSGARLTTADDRDAFCTEPIEISAPDGS